MQEDYVYVKMPEGKGIKRRYIIPKEELAQRGEYNTMPPVILTRRKIRTSTVFLAAIIYNSKEDIYHYEIGVQNSKKKPIISITISRSEGDILSAVDVYSRTVDAIGQRNEGAELKRGQKISNEERISNKDLSAKLKRFLGKIQI